MSATRNCSSQCHPTSWFAGISISKTDNSHRHTEKRQSKVRVNSEHWSAMARGSPPVAKQRCVLHVPLPSGNSRAGGLARCHMRHTLKENKGEYTHQVQKKDIPKQRNMLSLVCEVSLSLCKKMLPFQVILLCGHEGVQRLCSAMTAFVNKFHLKNNNK